MMDIGFNIIERNNPEIFPEKISIIKFLKGLEKGEKFSRDFAIIGVDSLIYYVENRDDISKYIKNILLDNVNQLVARNYIIQVIIEGRLEVVEDAEKPIVNYKNETFNLYQIFGRMKRIDLRHFHAPLNIQS